MRGFLSIVLVGVVLAACSGDRALQVPDRDGSKASTTPDPGQTFSKFVVRHSAAVVPLAKRLNLAYWQLATGGSSTALADLVNLELQIRGHFSSRTDFEYLEGSWAAGELKDPTQQRQLVLLLRQFGENQLPAELTRDLVRAGAELERKFIVQGLRVGDERPTESELIGSLAASFDPARRRVLWEAHAARGAAVRDDLIALVRLRNRAAHALGFSDYYQMRLLLDELDPDELSALCTRLERETAKAHRRLMGKLGLELSRRFEIPADQLRPWHFDDPFFQRRPAAVGLDLDPLFAGRDPVGLVRKTFERVGLDVSTLLSRSDLTDGPNKLPGAFCLDVDRAGDVRVSARLSQSEGSVATGLHELGHAAFRVGIDPHLAWILRTPAHEAVSEAVAEWFGGLTHDPDWLVAVFGLDPQRLKLRQADLAETRRMDGLLSTRFCLLMIHFERELYRDPDQDLNRLWNDLRVRYQGLAAVPGRDAPDWAAKLHLISVPVYYQNYLLASLMAAQLSERLAAARPKGAAALGPGSGDFLKKQIFAPGASLRWDGLWRSAVGKDLDPDSLLRTLAADTKH